MWVANLNFFYVFLFNLASVDVSVANQKSGNGQERSCKKNHQDSWEKAQTKPRLRDRISIGKKVEIPDLCTYRRRHPKTTTRKITRMLQTTTSTSIIAKRCDDKADHNDNKEHENTNT